MDERILQGDVVETDRALSPRGCRCLTGSVGQRWTCVCVCACVCVHVCLPVWPGPHQRVRAVQPAGNDPKQAHGDLTPCVPFRPTI